MKIFNLLLVSRKINISVFLKFTFIISGKDRIEGGAFDGVMDKDTPFMYKGGEGINAGMGEVEWVIAKDRYKYDAIFDALNPIDGKVTGAGKDFAH